MKTSGEPVLICCSVVSASPIALLEDQSALDIDVRAACSRQPRCVTEYLAARILLRRLLADVLGGAVATSPLAARLGGQPYLVACPEVGVSVSHSNGWVAAAMCTDGLIGIDIQVPVTAGSRLIGRCCTRSARAALTSMSQAARDSEFAWIWSVQEACVKATGEGIAGLPWTVPVEVGQHSGRWKDFSWFALRDLWPVPVSSAHYIRSASCRCMN